LVWIRARPPRPASRSFIRSGAGVDGRDLCVDERDGVFGDVPGSELGYAPARMGRRPAAAKDGSRWIGGVDEGAVAGGIAEIGAYSADVHGFVRRVDAQVEDADAVAARAMTDGAVDVEIRARVVRLEARVLFDGLVERREHADAFEGLELVGRAARPGIGQLRVELADLEPEAHARSLAVTIEALARPRHRPLVLADRE